MDVILISASFAWSLSQRYSRKITPLKDISNNHLRKLILTRISYAQTLQAETVNMTVYLANNTNKF